MGHNLQFEILHYMSYVGMLKFECKITKIITFLQIFRKFECFLLIIVWPCAHVHLLLEYTAWVGGK